MDELEKRERAAFARWIAHTYGVSTARYKAPAKDQYVIEAVNDAWKGWWARANATPISPSA